MKRRWIALFLALTMAASLLTGCTKKSDTPAQPEQGQTDSAKDADAAEEPAEDAAEPDDRVKPLPDAIDVTALTDATVAASYDYDRYDMVDISNLADGSVIVAGGKDMTVSSVERDGSLVLINGGLTKGGMTLTTQDDGVFYELGVNDVKCYQEKGEVKLPLSASFTLTDDSDPDHPNQTYGAEKLSELVSSGFTANNTLVTIENGEITAITRTVAP